MQGMPFRAVNQGSRNNIAETVKIKKKKKRSETHVTKVTCFMQARYRWGHSCEGESLEKFRMHHCYVGDEKRN